MLEKKFPNIWKHIWNLRTNNQGHHDTRDQRAPIGISCIPHQTHNSWILIINSKKVELNNDPVLPGLLLPMKHWAKDMERRSWESTPILEIRSRRPTEGSGFQPTPQRLSCEPCLGRNSEVHERKMSHTWPKATWNIAAENTGLHHWAQPGSWEIPTPQGGG